MSSSALPSVLTLSVGRKLRRSFRYTIATALIAILTSTLYYYRIETRLASVSMLFLLVITLVALVLGRGPAVWASLFAFLCFDWFFVNPRHAFTVAEPAEWIALFVFLTSAMVIGHLTVSLQNQALEAQQRQQETAALAEASWAVAAQLDTKSALLEVLSQMAKIVNVELAAILSKGDDSNKFDVLATYPADQEMATAEMEFVGNLVQSEGFVPCLVEFQSATIMPVSFGDTAFGIVYLRLAGSQDLSIQQQQILESLVRCSAVIFQRDRSLRKEAESVALAHADKLKTALLSMVTHDFRSPLTSIKASVSTLLQEGDPLPEDIQTGLYQAIEQETDRLNRMVGNILDLSKLEANAWRINPERTPVAEVIGMALDMFSSDNNARIMVHLDQDLPEVFADSTQLVQILKNLIENGLKYSPPESMIEIHSAWRDGTAIIEVLDRGRGLPDDPNDMFKPFWRAPELHESSMPGIGIGLAICRGLVEAHGGTIVAEARAGGGAIFRIGLPQSPHQQENISSACPSRR